MIRASEVFPAPAHSVVGWCVDLSSPQAASFQNCEAVIGSGSGCGSGHRPLHVGHPPPPLPSVRSVSHCQDSRARPPQNDGVKPTAAAGTRPLPRSDTGGCRQRVLTFSRVISGHGTRPCSLQQPGRRAAL